MRYFRFLAILALLFLASTCRGSNFLAGEGLKNLQEGKKITALKYFEEALDMNKKNPLALYGKGKIMLESRVTISLGQKLIENSLEKLDSEYLSDAYVSLAKSYAITNLYDKAIENLQEGFKRDVKSPEMYDDLAAYYLQKEDYTKAKDTYTEAVEKYPENFELVQGISNFYTKYYRNWNAAIDALENFKRNNSNNQDALVKTAMLYYQIRNKNKAIENLELLKNLQANQSEKKLTDQWIQQVQAGKWQINNP